MQIKVVPSQLLDRKTTSVAYQSLEEQGKWRYGLNLFSLLGEGMDMLSTASQQEANVREMTGLKHLFSMLVALCAQLSSPCWQVLFSSDHDSNLWGKSFLFLQG